MVKQSKKLKAPVGMEMVRGLLSESRCEAPRMSRQSIRREDKDTLDCLGLNEKILNLRLVDIFLGHKNPSIPADDFLQCNLIK